LANQLKEGMPVKVAGRPVSGKIISIGRAVDAASQSVLLRAAVSSGSEQLSPGQVIEVELAASSAEQNGNKQTLPAGALIRQQNQTLVFVQTVNSDKSLTLTARQVQVVSQGGDSVVVDGLRGDEIVVIKGVSSLKSMLTPAGDK
jgi:hypothetical protein